MAIITRWRWPPDTTDIEGQLGFLVEQRPTGLHLLLLSRTDPAFLTPRLLASGNAVRIGAKDLAFDTEETAAFLSTQSVDPGLTEVVNHRLGGWPAALRLLCLWIETHDDHQEAVARFARHDEIVAEYLASEVLNELDPDLRHFLATTSIPSRLSGPLCDALTGGHGGSETLLELHRRGFFVDAIDVDSGWFRYHHLVGEILGRLLISTGNANVDDLHRRASAWFATNGHGEEAIDHTIAARDWDTLHRLLLAELLAIGNRHPFAVIEGWLASVPTDVKSASAIYLLLEGFIHASTGRLHTARTILEQAATRVNDLEISDESAAIAALIVTVQAGIARLDADLTMARHYADAAEAHVADIGSDPAGHARLARVATTNSLAATLFWHGDLVGAEQRFAQMVIVATRDDMGRMEVNALAGMSLILVATGQITDAIALAEQSLDLAGPVGVLDSFQTNPAYLTKAIALLYRGDRIAARGAFLVVAERAERHGDRVPAMIAHLSLAHIATVEGELKLAASHLDATKRTWPHWDPPSPLAATERTVRGRLLLALDDRAGALGQRGATESRSGNDLETTVAKELLGAHVLVSHVSRRGATAFEVRARRASDNRNQLLALDSYLDATIAYHRLGDHPSASRCLAAAIELAHSEDLRGPFLDRSSAVRQTLLLLRQTIDEPAHAFATQLLRDLGVPGTVGPTDQLSERERTVHRLLRSTMTNAEIAAALDISPNTLKTHVRNVYRKLGVTNRTDALAAVSTVA